MRINPLLAVLSGLFILVLLLAGYVFYREVVSTSPNQTLVPQLIAYPTRTPTEEEILKNPASVDVEKIISLAEDTDVLHIIDCTSSPFVMRMKQNKKYIIRNNSLVDHTLSINEKTSFTIRAQSQKTITANFGEPGVYGYGCDTSGRAIGFFVVSDK